MADCVSRLKNGVLGSMDAAGIEWTNFDDEWIWDGKKCLGSEIMENCG